MRKKTNIKANKTKKIIAKPKQATNKKTAIKAKKTESKQVIKKKVAAKIEGRGRPPKVFISQKPQVKREGPGRPKKIEKVYLPEIPEKTENKTKDLIILMLFIISFIVFGFSIYINVSKKEDTENLLNEAVLNNSGDNVNIVVQDEKSLVIEWIYSAIQEEKFEEIYNNIDLSLKKSDTFKIFFGRNRLERFITNIDNKKIDVEIKEVEENLVKYTIIYEINQTPYTEEREANFIRRNDQRKVSKIMCTSNGCSKGPFFNPKRYY